MRNVAHPASFARISLVVVCALSAVAVGFLFRSEAQTTCVNPPAGTASWGDATTVCYRFDPNSNFTDNERNQSVQALNKWNTANQNNSSSVQFNPADASCPAALTFKTGSTPNGEFAYSNWSETNGTLSSATITFNKQATFPNSTIPVYDPNQAGADTFILKVALHEIGHTMGLAEVPKPSSNDFCDQQDGGSVMNAGCNQNDRGGNNPTDVTACDNGVVKNPACADPCADPSCPNFDMQICGDYTESGEGKTCEPAGCYAVWAVTDYYFLRCQGSSCTLTYLGRSYDRFLGIYCDMPLLECSAM